MAVVRKKSQTNLQESEKKPRDFVKIAIKYAKEAASDKNKCRFGLYVRLAAKRFLNDLERAKEKNPPFIFDKWHAEDPCRFIEGLPHVEGTWDTETIVLHPSHVFATVNIFGFRKHDGSRRFTNVLWAVARKNAKTTWAAGVALYCEVAEDEVGPKVFSAATTGTQARVVFDIAKSMVNLTSDLREYFAVEAYANAIACYKNGGTFKPINSKASTQDGLNPSCVIFDEIHAQRNHDLINVLKSAAGARRNPLFLMTTTEGYESPGPWPEERKFAQQILKGILKADHYFCVIYAIDSKDEAYGIDTADDIFDERVWPKANPLIDVNPLMLPKLRELAIEAKAMPGKLAEFSIKRCNRASASAESWINLPKWQACGGKVDLDWLEGYPCIAALDLSSNTDFTSWRLVWNVKGRLYTFGRRWVPTQAVTHRTERGTVPYQGWVNSGLIEMTEGDVIDHAVIEKRIRDDYSRFKPEKIAYDQWNAQDLVNRLTADDFPMIQFIQGTKSYHPAMQELERLYMLGKVNHGGDEVLQWCASNLVARRDVNLNMAPDKKKSADKIDDMVTLLMCIGVSIAPTEAEDDMSEFFKSPVIA